MPWASLIIHTLPPLVPSVRYRNASSMPRMKSRVQSWASISVIA